MTYQPAPNEFAPTVSGGKITHAKHVRYAQHGVDTIADLRLALASGTLAVGVVVRVGCHTVAGWGGGKYRVVSIGSYVDNNGTVITGGTQAALFVGTPACETFGAVGDGVVNCTTAVQAALDATLVADSGWFGRDRQRLRLTRGQYLITDTLSSPAHSGFWTLEGEGQNSSTFVWGGAAGKPMLLLRNASHAVCRDFGMRGSSGARPSSAIEVRRIAGYTGTVGISRNIFERIAIVSESVHVDNGIVYTCESAATDLNNEQAQIRNCTFVNYAESGFAARHLNSLLHSLIGCGFSTGASGAFAIDMLGDANSSVANVGGSFSATHCNSSGNAAIFRFGAGTWHSNKVEGWHSEPDGALFEVPHAPEGYASIVFADTGSQYYVQSIDVSAKMDVTIVGSRIAESNGTDFNVAAGGRLNLIANDLTSGASVVEGTLLRLHNHEHAGAPAFSGSGSLCFGVDSAAEAKEYGGTFTDGGIDFALQATFDPGLVYLTPTAPSSLKTLLHAFTPCHRVVLVARNGNLTIKHGTAATQIRLSGGVDVTLPAYGSVTLQHSQFDDHWFEISRSF